MRTHVKMRWPLAAALSLALSATMLAGCGGGGGGGTSQSPNSFTRTNLVSSVSGFTDSAGPAAHTDSNLKNPWGVSFSSTGPFWVSDNATGLSTLYNQSGAPQSLVVQIPKTGSPTGGAPTGQVFNNTADFGITGGAALFIFATEDGTISAWNASSGTNAVLKVDNSLSGAVYKGLALANNGSANFLYAANFNSGHIDVFDKNFLPALLPAGFNDPNVPAGFAPFNIQNIGGQLIVTYAKQDAAKHDDVAGAGNGLIDIFDTNGNLVKRLVTGSGAGGTVTQLNSPWGLARAPAGFGPFGGALLVGNFGDGRITAFDINTGVVLGQLQTSGGTPISISGLWALIFGNGGQAGPTSTLFFTAGINDESDGLMGSIVPSAAARSVSRK